MTRLKSETVIPIRFSLIVFFYSAHKCSLFQTILRLFAANLNYRSFGHN